MECAPRRSASCPPVNPNNRANARRWRHQCCWRMCWTKSSSGKCWHWKTEMDEWGKDGQSIQRDIGNTKSRCVSRMGPVLSVIEQLSTCQLISANGVPSGTAYSGECIQITASVLCVKLTRWNQIFSSAYLFYDEARKS